jgi:hypothetical protein
MLENMLEEISMPKALTTAPLDVPPLPAGPNRAHRAKHKTNSKGKGNVSDRPWGSPAFVGVDTLKLTEC